MRSAAAQAQRTTPQNGASSRPMGDHRTPYPLDVLPERYTRDEREMVLQVCEKYGFDPLGQEVMIMHGQVYVTAKGINRVATRDPAFDGIEVEIIEANWKNDWFLIKAKAWRKGCSHPVEEYADSDGSNLRGGNLFRHTITRAKARAQRAAFAIPFCSREELADEDWISRQYVGPGIHKNQGKVQPPSPQNQKPPLRPGQRIEPREDTQRTKPPQERTSAPQKQTSEATPAPQEDIKRTSSGQQTTPQVAQQAKALPPKTASAQTQNTRQPQSSTSSQRDKAANDIQRDHNDKGFHPGQRWKDANSRLRAVASERGITDAQLRAAIEYGFHVDSFKKLRASQLLDLATMLEREPDDTDLSYKQHIHDTIHGTCGGDPTDDEIEQLRSLIRKPWQAVFLKRVLEELRGDA